MSLLKEYFYNIECDVCGCLYNQELWTASPEDFSGEPEENGWLKLGGKDYCQDCWEFDEDDNIITSDGKKWNGETFEEIK